MQRIAQFDKVSRDRFRADWAALHPTQAQEADALYDALLLPRRATSGSAGYDFYLLHDLTLAPGASVLLPTGVRARIAAGWVLLLAPRSSLGFKFRLQLNNTVGVIDSDYYHSDNEGHIMAKLLNDGREGKSLVLKAGHRVHAGAVSALRHHGGRRRNAAPKRRLRFHQRGGESMSGRSIRMRSPRSCAR